MAEHCHVDCIGSKSLDIRRDKFIADIKSGLTGAKNAHKVDSTVTIDIADAQSGRVMESVSQ